MRSTRLLIFPLLVLMLALAVLAGCGGGDDEEAAGAPAAEAPADASVAQGGSPLIVSGGSPLPTPGSPLPTPGASGMVGVAGAETGAIVGRILVGRDTGDVPVAGLTVGLADVIRGEDGIARASGYAPDTPNRSATDDGDGFAINNVPPGTYTLILDAVITSYQLADPVSGDTILVEVQPGESVDIGVLRFETLPIPGFDK
ncbi:MAG: hypothetical protein ACRC1H_12095 [Caldilineaceae bacterium]